MKKILWVWAILCLTLSFSIACAEEAVLYDASDLAGLPTHYWLYDADFFEAEDEQAGTIVKMNYTTDIYDGKTYKRYVNVYLPYGYDEISDQRYNIIYFFHGNGCDQTTLLCNPQTKNALDHMISSGLTEPFIVVAPTYFYDVRHHLVDLDQFVIEMREQIMPLVEGTYKTYALTPDEKGFTASRDHRAISGFSRGSMSTWTMMGSMLDYSRYFLPFSGAGDEESLAHFKKAAEESGEEFFIYLACGGQDDLAFDSCVAQAQTLASDTALFSYGTDPEKNNLFFCLSDNPHLDLCSRYYLYNAFRDVLFK